MFRADSVVMARILAHIGCAALSALEEEMATRRLAGALGWPAIVSDAVAPEDDAAPAPSERGARQAPTRGKLLIAYGGGMADTIW
jgi:hypothetical protein